MVWKNLLRRKGRTFLTILGISIGVAAIVGLGALADGLEGGYSAMLTGSKADLVLSQPNSYDISYSSVEEDLAAELAAQPEVSAISGMLEGFVQAEGAPFFFLFGYPEDSFVLDRFQIVDGYPLDAPSARSARGDPLLLGSSAAETMEKKPGDTLRLGGGVFRVIGIYETGDAFEDSGAVTRLSEAQEVLGKPRQVSLFYIRLKSPELEVRFSERAARLWPELAVSGTETFADKQMMGDMLRGSVWVIAGLAVVIGGISMINSQLMSLLERTHEIGVLRAVGWSSRRILLMILGESLVISLLGGVLGVGLGHLLLFGLAGIGGYFGAVDVRIEADLLVQAFAIVLTLGLFSGTYPALRASRMQPVEALRYEGGSGGKVRRLPAGGMAVQSLWQRTIRTLLTLAVIGLTAGAIMALEGVVRGATSSFTEAFGSDAEVVVRQADIADTSLSALDERVGDKIAVMPEVANISGLVFTAVTLPDTGGFFILQGYSPNEFGIRRFNVVEGKPVTGNHQIVLGRLMANSMKKDVGDTIELAGQRFRVVGIYESGIGWEEMGGVSSLRDAQVLAGRPRKITMYLVKLHTPSDATLVVSRINQELDGTHAALAGEFVDQLPDMENMDAMMGSISFLAVFVGGVGVMNAMLMAVLERTRETGVLRAMGWGRGSVLSLILREALLLGILGGLSGIALAFGMGYLISNAPVLGEAMKPAWGWDIFARTIAIAVSLGVAGGLYPAWRATLLQPVEALRYE